MPEKLPESPNRLRPGMLVLLTIVAIIVAIVIARFTGVGTSTPAVGSTAGIPDAATPAVVEYVHDGDTLFLEDGRKVRLLGVNTPEVGDERECYGDEARTLLRTLLPEGAEVMVLEDADPLDQYGRSLLFVFTASGENVNLELLRQGAAEVEQYAPNLLLQSELEEAERTARDADVGMWGQC